MEFLLDTIRAMWVLMLDSGVWLIAGLALAGVLHVLMPKAWLTRQLGGKGMTPIAKAALLGIPLPLCSCSVIPVAAQLRRGGASKGASAAFAISTPQTGEESIPLTWALLGPVFALTRPVVAIATAFSAGVLIEKFAGDRPKGADDSTTGAQTPAKTQPAGSVKSCCATPTEAQGALALPILDGVDVQISPAIVESGASCCATSPPDGLADQPRSRVRSGAEYAFITMLRDLAPWLAAGFVVSAIIAAAIPPDWIGRNIGTGLGPMLLMLVVGLPLYICATASTPLAYTLVVAGLSPGAALVLLLVGPATNAATMAWVLKDLGRRALAIYLLVIAVMAVACGLLFDAAFSGAIRLAVRDGFHDHSAGLIAYAGGAIFSAMLIWALITRYCIPAKRR